MKKILVEYADYERYGGGRYGRVHFKGEDLYSCISKMCDYMSLYKDSESIDAGYEEAVEEEPNLTRDEYIIRVIEDIDMSNGDGCDFILLLKDEDSGEVYIDSYEEG